MATSNNTTSTYDSETKLVNAIMQLDAMMNLVCTSQDFSMKHDLIKENYLVAYCDKLDTIREAAAELIPNPEKLVIYR